MLIFLTQQVIMKESTDASNSSQRTRVIEDSFIA